MKNLPASLLTCAALMMTTSTAMSPEAADAGARFRALADQYFSDVMFRFGPTNATVAGFHQYDAKLEDYSRAGVDAEIAALKEFEWKFDDFSETGLDESTKADLAIMRSQVRSNLLELETVRAWQKNPDTYSSGIASSAFALMERDFAPPDERLRSLVAREKQMPAVFTEAREEPRKSSAHLYGDCAGTAAGDRRLLPPRRAGRIQSGEGCGHEGGVPEDERRGDGGARRATRGG